MSLKYGRRPLRTNLPPVCRKPPKPLPPGPLPTHPWPLRLYCSIVDNASSVHTRAAAILDLHPLPATTTWSGTKQLDDYAISAIVQYDPWDSTLDIEIHYTFGGAPIGDWTIYDYPVPRTVPWSTPRIQLAPPPDDVNASIVIAT